MQANCGQRAYQVSKLAILLGKDEDWISRNYIKPLKEEYVDVSGKYICPKNEEEEFSQAIEFTPQKKWLAMAIGAESLENFTELEILAHCLYEMTLVGFEEEGIQEQLNSIEKTAEDYKMMSEEDKRKYTTSLDELLDEIKEDDQENDHL